MVSGGSYFTVISKSKLTQLLNNLSVAEISEFCLVALHRDFSRKRGVVQRFISVIHSSNYCSRNFGDFEKYDCYKWAKIT
jgi:hypothetical protein